MTNNQQSSDVCWYCKKNPADRRFAASIPMYTVTGGDYKDYGAVGVNKIDFNRIGVQVPRCETCQKRQRVLQNITRGIQVILFVAGLIVLGAAAGLGIHIIPYPYDPMNQIGILGIVGVLLWVISWNTQTILNVILSAISPIKPEFYGSTSPEVQKMLAAKWRVGKKPMG